MARGNQVEHAPHWPKHGPLPSIAGGAQQPMLPMATVPSAESGINPTAGQWMLGLTGDTQAAIFHYADLMVKQRVLEAGNETQALYFNQHMVLNKYLQKNQPMMARGRYGMLQPERQVLEHPPCWACLDPEEIEQLQHEHPNAQRHLLTAAGRNGTDSGAGGGPVAPASTDEASRSALTPRRRGGGLFGCFGGGTTQVVPEGDLTGVRPSTLTATAGHAFAAASAPVPPAPMSPVEAFALVPALDQLRQTQDPQAALTPQLTAPAATATALRPPPPSSEAQPLSAIVPLPPLASPRMLTPRPPPSLGAASHAPQVLPGGILSDGGAPPSGPAAPAFANTAALGAAVSAHAEATESEAAALPAVAGVSDGGSGSDSAVHGQQGRGDAHVSAERHPAPHEPQLPEGLQPAKSLPTQAHQQPVHASAPSDRSDSVRDPAENSPGQKGPDEGGANVAVLERLPISSLGGGSGANASATLAGLHSQPAAPPPSQGALAGHAGPVQPEDSLEELFAG